LLLPVIGAKVTTLQSLGRFHKSGKVLLAGLNLFTRAAALS